MATIRRWGQKPSLGQPPPAQAQGSPLQNPAPSITPRTLFTERGETRPCPHPQHPLPQGGLLCSGSTAPWARSPQVWTASPCSPSRVPEPGETRGTGAGGWPSAGAPTALGAPASSLAPVSGVTRASETHSLARRVCSRSVEATARSLRPWGPQGTALPQVTPGTAAPPPASRGRHATTVCARLRPPGWRRALPTPGFCYQAAGALHTPTLTPCDVITPSLVTRPGTFRRLFP